MKLGLSFAPLAEQPVKAIPCPRGAPVRAPPPCLDVATAGTRSGGRGRDFEAGGHWPPAPLRLHPLSRCTPVGLRGPLKTRGAPSRKGPQRCSREERPVRPPGRTPGRCSANTGAQPSRCTGAVRRPGRCTRFGAPGRRAQGARVVRHEGSSSPGKGHEAAKEWVGANKGAFHDGLDMSSSLTLCCSVAIIVLL